MAAYIQVSSSSLSFQEGQSASLVITWQKPPISVVQGITSITGVDIEWDKGGGSPTYIVSNASTTGTATLNVNANMASAGYIRIHAHWHATHITDGNVTYFDPATSRVVVSVTVTPRPTSPGAPSSITVPSPVNAGEQFTVSWGAAASTGSGMSGYILERRLFDGTNWSVYAAVYNGTARSFNDTITAQYIKVQYRVLTKSSTTASNSGYRTSAEVSVVSNAPPVIDGTDSDMGLKDAPFSIDYTPSDPDPGDSTLTVNIEIDGIGRQQLTANNGTQYTFSLTDDDWIILQNGAHAITITARDSQNAHYTRTYTFSKNETEILVELKNPIPRAAKPNNIVLTVPRVIPSGAIFEVFVTNNAIDDAPVWEDCTAAVLAGDFHSFANADKTAAYWGVNVRVHVERNGAVGDCHIAGVGGSFN
jgi:hypothetical protein